LNNDENILIGGRGMIDDTILAIKDSILSTVGESCEKIYLFGSYAYGTPREDSDYDFFVVLKDGTEKPIQVMQKIYEYMCDTHLVPVDVIAQYKTRFEWKSKQTTMERRIANEGVVLYDAARISGHLINAPRLTERSDV
jgi:predicted nucleotidyltransferase